MAFRVSGKQWLTTEGDRIQAIILAPRFWRVKWTDKSLRGALRDIGLEYTAEEITLLNDELHTRGIVEDVQDSPTLPSVTIVIT